MQNVIEFYRKYFSCGKNIAFGVWSLRLALGQLGPKDLQLHSNKSRTLDPIFTNKASFYAEYAKLNKMFYLNIRIYLLLH